MQKMKKHVALMMAMMLILGCAIGGTVAWLTATPVSVTNTFGTSDINVTLNESENLDLQMIPGHTITKDPNATVTAGSEDCYLFVKVEKLNSFDAFMTYSIADGWIKLNVPDMPDTEEVYYRIFNSKDEENQNAKGTPYPILAGNQVTVKETVTKEMMTDLTTDKDNYPKLTFTACAMQLYKSNNVEFTVAEAWEQVPEEFKN